MLSLIHGKVTRLGRSLLAVLFLSAAAHAGDDGAQTSQPKSAKRKGKHTDTGAAHPRVDEQRTPQPGASSTDPVALGAIAENSVVVMPVETAGYLNELASTQEDFDLALLNRLKNFPKYAPSVRLKRDDPSASCQTPTCLAKVAMACNAKLLVGGKVINRGGPQPTFDVRVWLFDPAKPDAFAYDKTRSQEDGNESASADWLGKQLGEALALLENPAPTDKPREVLREHHEENQDPAQMSLRTRWIVRGFALGLGVVAGFGLVQGAVEVMHNGDRVGPQGEATCGAQCGYHLDTAKGQAVFFGVGATAAVTAAVLAGIGWWPEKKNVKLAPAVSTTGAQLNLEVRF